MCLAKYHKKIEQRNAGSTSFNSLTSGQVEVNQISIKHMQLSTCDCFSRQMGLHVIQEGRILLAQELGKVK